MPWIVKQLPFIPGDMLKSFFEALIFSLTVVGISNQYAVDLGRVTVGYIAVDLGVLFAAIANQNKLTFSIVLQNRLNLTGFGLGALFK